jgi:hypothetical protein
MYWPGLISSAKLMPMAIAMTVVATKWEKIRRAAFRGNSGPGQDVSPKTIEPNTRGITTI